MHILEPCRECDYIPTEGDKVFDIDNGMVILECPQCGLFYSQPCAGDINEVKLELMEMWNQRLEKEDYYG